MSKIRKTVISNGDVEPEFIVNKIEGIGNALSELTCEESYEKRNKLAIALIDELYPTIDATLFQKFRRR